MAPQFLNNIFRSLERNLTDDHLAAADDRHLGYLETALKRELSRIGDERDNRRMDIIGQNGPTGDHYGEMA